MCWSEALIERKDRKVKSDADTTAAETSKCVQRSINSHCASFYNDVHSSEPRRHYITPSYYAHDQFNYHHVGFHASFSSTSSQPSCANSGDTPGNDSQLSDTTRSVESRSGHTRTFDVQDFLRRINKRIRQLTPPQDRRSDKDIERKLQHCLTRTQKNASFLRTHWVEFDTFHCCYIPIRNHLFKCTPEQRLCFRAALVLPNQPHLLKTEGSTALWTCAPS